MPPEPRAATRRAPPVARRKDSGIFADDHCSLDSCGRSDSSALTSDPASSVRKRSVNGTRPASPKPPAKKARLSREERVQAISGAVSTILECIGEDPGRQGLLKTPERYAKALLSLTEGYAKTVRDVMGDAEFDENHSEMVLVRDIKIFSMCEHHMLPFHGSCHVAYIPSGPVIGLSKIARIIDMFARRLQIQERLTAQIADAIQDATNAVGVMVHVSCAHLCMSMRGVQKVGAETVTTAARGRYSTEPGMRREFLGAINS